MRQKSHSTDLSSEELVKGIRRATRKRYSAEEHLTTDKRHLFRQYTPYLMSVK